MVNSPVQTLLYSENSPNPDLMVVCHRPWSNPPTSITSGLRAEQSIIITLASDLDLRCFLSMLQLIHIWKTETAKIKKDYREEAKQLNNKVLAPHFGHGRRSVPEPQTDPKPNKHCCDDLFI